MNRSFVIGCALILAACGRTESSVVRGAVTLNSYGLAQVAECGTSREFRLGVMADTAYFKFTRSYDEASQAGTKPVVIEVSGTLAASSDSPGQLILESPTVISLTSGSCDA